MGAAQHEKFHEKVLSEHIGGAHHHEHIFSVRIEFLTTSADRTQM